jgi:hypothetical protein
MNQAYGFWAQLKLENGIGLRLSGTTEMLENGISLRLLQVLGRKELDIRAVGSMNIVTMVQIIIEITDRLDQGRGS